MDSRDDIEEAAKRMALIRSLQKQVPVGIAA
jgi:hypothetical protein